MGLKDEITQASAALVKREPCALPKCKKTVLVHGLMTGEMERVRAAKEGEQSTVLVCLCTEDPATPGVPLYNVNDLNDRMAAGKLHIKDTEAIVNKHNELAGLSETADQLLGNLDPEGSSSYSSPSATESPLTN